MHHLQLRAACSNHVRLYCCPQIYISQQHPKLWRGFATSFARLKKSTSQETTDQGPELKKPKIRWYQQLLPWSTTRTPADGDLAHLPGEQYEEAKWLKDAIAKDDADLRRMEGLEGKTMVEPLLATLAKTDARKIRDAIQAEDLRDARREEQVAAVKRRLDKHLPKKEELAIQMQVPREQNTYLQSFNENLHKTSTNLTSKNLRKKLWQAYIRCKAFLPPFLHLIPEKSWNVVWASQQTATPDDPHWGPHIITLSEDITKGGKELNVYQRILYVEALLSQGRQVLAIEQWQDLRKHIGDDQKASEEHELLGVRLFASHDDPEKAERIALAFLGSEKQEESRILIPILHTWAQRRDDIGIQHAFALYLRFRAHVGSDITMDDYDHITMSFLDVGRTDIALAVFKDMMLTGQNTDEGSMELYRKSLDIMGKTQESAITAEDLNTISLTGLIVLPRKFQNKFFYGCWLKRLLGMGAVQSACRVIELMYERGVQPDAKHLNGIIGAWLRSGEDKDMEAAEKMAWAMIHERLEFVSKRQRGEETEPPKLPRIKGVLIAPHLRRSVALANIETFSLLLQHYGRRVKYDNVELIKSTLKRAEIRPNSYFTNHLLYLDLRCGELSAAWTKYKEMCGTLKPDLETFACLWELEQSHLDTLLIHSYDRFPGPREIMYEMMTWFSTLSAQRNDYEAIKQEFNKQLYDRIIGCMASASDLEGLIVSLYALKESFGFYPDMETYKLVTIRVSRMKVREQKYVLKPGRYSLGRGQRRIKANNIAGVLGLVIGQREATLAQHGLKDVAEIDDDIQREEGLFRLVDFLRAVLRRIGKDDGAVESNIHKAAWVMGVGGIRMEDPLRSYVATKDMYRNSRLKVAA